MARFKTSESFSIGAVWTKLIELIRRSAVLLVRIAIVLVVAIIFAKKLGFDIFQFLADQLKTDKTSFYITFSLLLMLVILDTILQLRKTLENTGGIKLSLSEQDGYRELIERIRLGKWSNVTSVDLLQLSGNTSLELLREIFREYPKVHVRMLLLHHDIARMYVNSKFDHVRRIQQTVEDTNLIPEVECDANRLEIRYYRAFPSVCFANIKDHAISAGWYRSFHSGQNEYHVRSHDVPSLLAMDAIPAALQKFATDHFNKLWEFSEQSATSSELTTTFPNNTHPSLENH